MLSSEPMEVYRIMGDTETLPHNDFSVKEWFEFC